jgi:hypothetical protein
MKRTYRMYGLVPYNISPIQQGIQYGHAVVEYSLKFGDNEDYKHWATRDKTFIILNGGTTNSRRFDGDYIGSLNRHLKTLSIAGVQTADFFEPDLGDQLTAVVFLIDDRVFDKEAWPEFKGVDYNDGTHDPEEYQEWKMKFADTEADADRIIFLREFLKNFRLA